MNLMQYITKAKNAIANAYWELEAAIMKQNKATDNIRAKAASDSSYTHIQASDDELKASTDFNNAIAKLQKECTDAIDVIRGEFTNAVHENYRPDGDKINDADVKILNCGIELSNSEVIDMVIRNRDNCTMLRLIGNYIAKWKLTGLPKSIDMALYRATKAGAGEIKAFDDFVHLASMGLKHQDGSYIYVQRRLDEYEADAKTALDKAKPYISPEELKAIEAAELARKDNFQPMSI